MQVGRSDKHSVLVETAGDNVFFNVTFNNPNTDGRYLPVAMVFSESRTTPLLPGNTQDYKMSVVRFDLPADLIPIQFFPTSDLDRDTSTYSVTITWNGFENQVFLTWVPESNLGPTPLSPFALSDKPFYHEYYSLFTIEHFMKLINAALLAAHNATVLDGAPIVADVAPFMYYNPATGLISLYAPTAYNSDNGTPINIYLNDALTVNFRTSFPTFIQSHSSVNGTDTQLLVHDNIINRTTITLTIPGPGPTTYDFLIMSQEFNALNFMYDIASIIVTSTSIPMRNEWTNIEGSNNNNYLSIVADFLVPSVNGNETRNRIVYYPTAQFRYSTLTSNMPIQVIDLQFNWKSKTGQLYPIYISPYKEGSIKILFEKK